MIDEPPRLEVQRLPNHALRARIPLRAHPLVAMLPAFVRRRLLAETAPGLAISRPLGMLVTLLAMASLAQFLGGPDWRYLANALVALVAFALVLGVEMSWRTARRLGSQELGLAVGKGQLLIWPVEGKTAEVDAPLEKCRLELTRGMLVVRVGEELHAWEPGCPIAEVRELIESVEAIHEAFGGASDVPEQLRSTMREAKTQPG